MNRALSLSALFILAAGCTSTDAIDARSELLISATSGAEEALARGDDGEAAPTEDPDQPPLFRECDAEGTFVGLMARYDEDGDGELGPPEEDAVFDARAERDPDEAMRGEQRMHFLGLVYDTDRSGEIDDDDELTVLFEDFTVRCEVLHTRLLEDFDADGDGTLSEEEMQAAGDAIRAEMESIREDGPPECDSGEGGPEGMGGPGAERGERPDPDAVPEPLSDYDTDGDGLWSDEELDGFRADARAAIRDGAPLGGPPPAADE